MHLINTDEYCVAAHIDILSCAPARVVEQLCLSSFQHTFFFWVCAQGKLDCACMVDKASSQEERCMCPHWQMYLCKIG